jgi:hypothetical protein
MTTHEKTANHLAERRARHDERDSLTDEKSVVY